MGYFQLTIQERYIIELYLQENKSISLIAKRLNRSRSTISREIKRNRTDGTYQAERAHDQAITRSQTRNASKGTHALFEEISHCLQLSWSPEQISGRMNRERKQTVSFKTIYRWLYAGILYANPVLMLRQKGKRRQPEDTRGKIKCGKSIHIRPKEAEERQVLGYWELDTMLSSRGKSKGCLATFVERKTRYLIALPIPNRTAASMNQSIRTVGATLPEHAFHSATCDRGKEFAQHEQIEKEVGIDVYFADAYSSWQRGTNENTNGLLREFFPKGTDFLQISEEELSQAVDSINHRPRKCLKWLSAHETFMAELLHFD